MDTGLLVLRVVVGLLLVGHGARKLFGWFGGGGLTAAAWFQDGRRRQRDAQPDGEGRASDQLGAAGEPGHEAGRPVAAHTMLNAGVAVHRRNGRLAIGGGYAYSLGIAAVAATLGFTGAGALSLDATLGLGDGGVASGLFALALGLVGGSAVLLSRAAAPEARPGSRLSPTDKVAA